MSLIYKITKPSSDCIQGEVQLNGSKSISNRVLIIDALCNHQLQLENISNADDTVFLQQILQSNDAVLDAGAGGTTFRFLTAYLSTQEGREVVLTGSERMQQRPIKILVDALLQLGADISYVNKEGFPPLRIRGKKLKGGKISLPADTSSQYITALLLIAPTLQEGLTLELIGKIVSVPYIKMTLKIMEYFGVKSTFTNNIITVESSQYEPKPFYIEGDWSAASYYYSIAILAKEATITLKGLTAQQIQGDAVIADIATKFGVQTTYNNKAVTLTKTAQVQPAHFQYDFLECPDLAQTVVSFCAALQTAVNCNGLQTLRIKETDRIAALDIELQKLGLASLVEIDSNAWKLNILDQSQININLPIHTYEDHRMAMAFAPLVIKTNEILIEEPNVVTKSYPLFWKDLAALGFTISSI
ncbi:MAG TPA: 3-phosphoshikimate 1-carboxyvinyltransferase [Chitinophagales bacterium]|nr:3-phosphoshikimate 1-carboxyvinyltransferase [Chitinophagales bacterium]HNF18597.1 3-phosphoshikimate 1-carboxyvinyltransferase [Chitinophagales bacterium]HNG71695.1 3-phosphoshikimate 1-carboxyvinyltransferase [Chitinophagales bacterium]HNL56356.1 3-phosphoshikimate 1-carboxyvinyltransferase [Chitinophagales bacterium]HNN26188.1 3-phosphoshikimate 1-carboxyvinyltransferase [Chitinophagales bacterium]